MKYDCQQDSKEIICSLDFPSTWASQKDIHFNDVNFTVLDCVRQNRKGCSLENGCDIIGSENVSLKSNGKAYFSHPDTCSTHTYCIVAAVSMDTGELVYFNKTPRKLHEKE